MLLRCVPFLFLLKGSLAPTMMAESQKNDQERRRAAAVVGAVLERLQRIVPMVERAASCPRAQEPAGRYSSETPSLAQKMGGGYLSGDSMYLFRDGSFLYTEWADVFPEAVMGRGRWSLHDDLLELQSDSVAVKKGGLQDTDYVVFCFRESGRRALRIIGKNRELDQLEKHFVEDPGTADDRRFLVMLYSRERLQEFLTSEASRRAMEELRRRIEIP
jgi:hypothetical protein